MISAFLYEDFSKSIVASNIFYLDKTNITIYIEKVNR